MHHLTLHSCTSMKIEAAYGERLDNCVNLAIETAAGSFMVHCFGLPEAVVERLVEALGKPLTDYRAGRRMLADALRAYEYLATIPYGDDLHRTVLKNADARRCAALAATESSA